jgi:hypothetical protein
MRSSFRKSGPRKLISNTVQQQPAAEEAQQKKIHHRKPKSDEKEDRNRKNTSNCCRRKKRNGSCKKNEDRQTDGDSAGWHCQSEMGSVGWKLDRKTIRDRNKVPMMLNDFMSTLASETEPPFVLVEHRSAAYDEERRRLLVMTMGCSSRSGNRDAPVLRGWTHDDHHYFKTEDDTDISKYFFTTTTKHHSSATTFNPWTRGLLVKPPSFEEQTTVSEMLWDSKANDDDSKGIEVISDDWDPLDVESVDLSPYSALFSDSLDSAVKMKPTQRWRTEWPRRS